MAQGYYIESAGLDNLKRYATYVEECIKINLVPYPYDKWMKTVIIPQILGT